MKLPTIPTPEELLDKGFKRGKKAADLKRSERMPKHIKGKKVEEVRVVTSCQVIKAKLKSIIDSTPEIEELPMFYQDYIDITVGLSPSLKRIILQELENLLLKRQQALEKRHMEEFPLLLKRYPRIWTFWTLQRII